MSIAFTPFEPCILTELRHEWVRDNIKAFGGNPEKITIWVRRTARACNRIAYKGQGQSAGASSTDFHGFAYHNDTIAKGLVVRPASRSLALRRISLHGDERL